MVSYIKIILKMYNTFTASCTSLTVGFLTKKLYTSILLSHEDIDNYWNSNTDTKFLQITTMVIQNKSRSTKDFRYLLLNAV